MRVLIISYYFSPCELTAANRTASWARYFPQNGINCTVVTRKWERPIKTFTDIGYSTTPGVTVEQCENCTIHRVPYTASVKDLLFQKYTGKIAIILRKFLSLMELLVQNISLRLSSYHEMYSIAKEICENEKIDAIIISGQPFISFKIGYHLNKKFNIPWIADYRDAWTTCKMSFVGRASSYKILNEYDRFFEKKWIKTAKFITSVSEPLAKEIGEFVQRPYRVIENGFEDNLFDSIPALPKYPIFTITHVGTLYRIQDISIFLQACTNFIKKNSISSDDFRIRFLGLAIDTQQVSRVLNFSNELIPYIETTNRISHSEVLLAERQSHLLLFVGMPDITGITSSRIYEYCASGTQILLAPNDHGVVNNILKSSKTGASFDYASDVSEFLTQCYLKYLDGNFDLFSGIETNVEQYKRSIQAAKFATHLKEDFRQ